MSHRKPMSLILYIGVIVKTRFLWSKANSFHPCYFGQVYSNDANSMTSLN